MIDIGMKKKQSGFAKTSGSDLDRHIELAEEIFFH